MIESRPNGAANHGMPAPRMPSGVAPSARATRSRSASMSSRSCASAASNATLLHDTRVAVARNASCSRASLRAPLAEGHGHDVGVVAAPRLDHHLEHRRLARRQLQLPARPAGVDARRLGHHAHLGAIAHPVEPVVAERQPIARAHRRQDPPAPRAPHAAHLEHVGEVGVHAQLEPQVDGAPQVVGDHQLLDQPTVEQQLAPDVQEVLRIVEEAAELAIGERQVDLRRRRARRLRRQHHRRAARDAQLEIRQVARVLVKQPELARARRRDVAARVEHAEAVAARQHQRRGLARRRQLQRLAATTSSDRFSCSDITHPRAHALVEAT